MSAGRPSDLSEASCAAIAQMARHGTPLPAWVRREIAALAASRGAPNPFASHVREVPALRYVELWCPWYPPTYQPCGEQLRLPLRRPK